ncbi:hypothetical protein [Spongiimicrobium sp. 3-5]|uniref:hypothetical protein n=1 Tax=Spongiimicrobium sp. 3-5 TaxID=3332596 RepID=UPI00397F176F
MFKSEIEKYKDYPEGSGGKMMYDKYFMTTKDFFSKYYFEADLKDWDRWMNNTINKAWNKNHRAEFLQSWGERMKYFDFLEMERFYKEENLSKFDEDVKKFVSFLAGDGFFYKNKITLESWITSKNFTNPIKNHEQDIRISQALSLKGGMNYIRIQLANLHWWRQ